MVSESLLGGFGGNASSCVRAVGSGCAVEFFRGRLKALWSESYRTDVVEAVLSVGFDDLVAARLAYTGAKARGLGQGVVF